MAVPPEILFRTSWGVWNIEEGGLIGQTISHYRILERLGGGGMGIVYRAQDTRLDRTVALKFLPIEWCQEPLLRERFTREARAASNLDHPHICTVFDIDETPEGQLFIAMAYCPGETLKERILRGPLPINDAVDLAIQIGEAVGSAHEAGIVHRDVKPGNILITGSHQVKVVDFGLAKLAGEAAVTRQGSVVGTPAYMSPEQAIGVEVDGRSDVWALGVVLYEMLAGRRAFAADHEQAILLAITSKDPTPIENVRPDVPAELLRIIRRCLKRKPEERYQNAGELVADLRRFRGDPTAADIVTQTLPSIGGIRRLWSLKRRVLPAAVAVAAVILTATLYPALTRAPTQHVVVLPFDCLVKDYRTTQLCRGLLETVTAELAELRRFRSSLSVIPTSEVFGQRVASAEDARRVFGADLVVAGSVMREGDTLRIPLRLIDAATLRQLRTRTITTEMTADFALQDRVVAAVEEMLEVELGDVEKRSMAAGGTRHVEAAELYLEARGVSAEPDSEAEIASAMNLFRGALELDPRYANAFVQLADLCRQRFLLTNDPIWIEHGISYARRALDSEPDLATAHLAAGRLELSRAAYPAAITRLERAIALDPLGLRAYTDLAAAYEATGDVEQAEETLDRAVRTGPDDWQTHYTMGRFYLFEQNDPVRAEDFFRRLIELNPDSSIGYAALGASLFAAGDRVGARENLERAVEIGDLYWALSNLATIDFYDGNYAAAEQLYRRALAIDGSDYTVWNNLAEVSRLAGGDTEQVGSAYRRAADLAAAKLQADPNNVALRIDLASFDVHLGKQAGAREHLARVEELGVDDVHLMFSVGDAYERLGERDRALHWIRRALEGGFPLQYLEDYPDFDDLRADPRFAELVAAVGAEQ